MKTIQITIDEDLLACVDETVGSLGTSRSAFLREAIRVALHEIRIAEMERQHAEAYAQQPDRPDGIDEWLEIQEWQPA